MNTKGTGAFLLGVVGVGLLLGFAWLFGVDALIRLSGLAAPAFHAIYTWGAIGLASACLWLLKRMKGGDTLASGIVTGLASVFGFTAILAFILSLPIYATPR